MGAGGCCRSGGFAAPAVRRATVGGNPGRNVRRGSGRGRVVMRAAGGPSGRGALVDAGSVRSGDVEARGGTATDGGVGGTRVGRGFGRLRFRGTGSAIPPSS